MTELRFEFDDGPITVFVDYDKPVKCIDLEKLDADLAAIDANKCDVAVEDDTDYDKHAWETLKGHLINAIFAEVDAGIEV